MKGKGVDTIIWLWVGIFFLFMGRCFSVVSNGSVLETSCVGAPFLIGLVITIGNLSIDDCSLNRMQRLATGLIWTAVLCFIFAWWLSSQAAMPPNQRTLGPNLIKHYSIEGHVLTGIFLIFFGGIGLWFVTSPPNIGKTSKTIREGGILNSSGNEHKSSYLVLTESNQPSGDIIDQALWDIMNADTHLRSMMSANPDLAGKIQQTFNYYDPNAGVFRSWAMT